MPGITVGVDGSHGAHQALEWAIKEAAVHDAPLTVLTVHEVAASGWTGNPIILPPTCRPWKKPVRQRRRPCGRPSASWASRGRRP